MAFSSVTNTDWSAVSFLNEIIAGIRERQHAAGIASANVRIDVVAGDDVQKREFYSLFNYAFPTLHGLQTAIEQLIGVYPYAAPPMGFVNHTLGPDFSGSASIPLWTATTFFAALNSGGTSWRRQTEFGAWTAQGNMQVGDIIGPWIFEDLQNALKLLKWIVTYQGSSSCQSFWSTEGGNNTYLGVGSSEYVGDPSSVAEDAAQAAWHAAGGSYPIAGTQLYQEPSYVVYDATIRRAYSHATANGLYTFSSLSAAVDLYFTARIAFPAATHPTFDDNGDTIHESSTLYLQRTGLSYDGSGGLAVLVGTVIDPADTFPLWCVDPASGESTSKGYEVNSLPVFVIKYETVFTWI